MDTTSFEAPLLNHTLDVVVVIDTSGRLRYANAAVERVLGYPPTKLYGHDAFSLIHPDDRAAVKATFEQLVDTDCDADPTSRPPSEFRFRAADNSWVWLAAQMSNEPALGSDEYVVSCRDITERRQAEAERRQAHERLVHIAEHTHDVLWMFSADWEELLFVNSAYETLWGRSKADLESDPSDFLRGIHPADREGVETSMAHLAAGEPIDTEYRVNASKGFGTWVWVQGYPITDDDGTVTAVVGFARDITDRRERERQLLVMDRLLRHNLRNEMNLILGHAEQIRSEADTGVESSVEKIVDVSERLLRTVEKERDIVSLLTDDADRLVLDMVPLVEDIAARVCADSPHVTLELTLPETAPVKAVPKLSLAIYELLTNPIKHADTAHPVISVTLAVEGETVRLSVADECPPIPLQEIRVLEGVRDVRSVYHGSGLGLWLVHWAVDRSDGALSFKTNGERGNTVVVTLEGAEATDGVGVEAAERAEKEID